MSLRIRLILGVVLVLVAGVATAGVLVYWQAADELDTELDAALGVGGRTAQAAVEEARGRSDPWVPLIAWVHGLDGDRHLSATVLDERGGVRARSQPLPAADPAPDWFYRLLASRARERRLPLAAAPGDSAPGMILLATDAHNEISEVWNSTCLMFGTLAVVCLLNAVLLAWLASHALAPLRRVAAACAQLGEGDHDVRLPESGVGELRQLGRGFNQMAARLTALARRQLVLEEQLSQVQDEERAELARDLHDEVGPLLFAINVDLAVLQQHETVSAHPALQTRLGVTCEAVGHMQRTLRCMLACLRPPSAADLGLPQAIRRLVDFWQTRHPHITFEVSRVDGSLEGRLLPRIHPIVQQSLSQAVRHGRPRHVEVSVDRDGARELRVQVRDDGVQLSARGTAAGLAGLRERVVSSGGRMEVDGSPQGRGVVVVARLPLAQSGETGA